MCQPDKREADLQGVDGRKPEGERHYLDDPRPIPLIRVKFPPFRSFTTNFTG
jgi:hypothetical protein